MILQVYQTLRDKVNFICEKLKLSKYDNTTGRKLKIGIPQIITLALYKQTQGIAAKKSIWNDFKKEKTVSGTLFWSPGISYTAFKAEFLNRIIHLLFRPVRPASFDGISNIFNLFFGFRLINPKPIIIRLFNRPGT